MERGRRLRLLMVAGAIALALPASAQGATIAVTTIVDEAGMTSTADCSLREAIRSANLNVAVGGCTAGSGPDQVVLGAETYPLTVQGSGENAAVTGDLDVTESLTLAGAGEAATTIDAGSTSTTLGGARDRVLHVLAGATVTVERLTIAGGRTGRGTNGSPDLGADGSGGKGDGGDGGEGESGGGVLNDGVLTLRAVTVTGNTTGAGGDAGAGTGGSGAPGGGAGGEGEGSRGGDGGAGGGVFTTGQLVVEDCTISANLTGDGGRGGQGIGGAGGGGGTGGLGDAGSGADGGRGGGLAASDAAQVSVSDSTIIGNATGAGGASGEALGGFGGDADLAGNGGEGGGSFAGDGGNGGGLADVDTVVRSTITGNATGAGGAGAAAQGGSGGFGADVGGDGGDALGGTGGFGGHGGGIYSRGTIADSTVSGNATGPAGQGAAGAGGNGGDSDLVGGAGGDGTGGDGGEGGSGGGVFGENSLVLATSTLTGNETGDGGDGGGSTAGQAGDAPFGDPEAGDAIHGRGERGGDGGGLAVSGSGATSLTATNVTIVENATGDGGDGGDGAGGGRGGNGSAVSVGPFFSGSFRLVHGTVGLGTLGTGGTGGPTVPDGAGNAVAETGLGVATVQNTILAGSCSGTITGDGNNLSPNGPADGCPANAGDPVLLTLGDNGGPTQTQALGPGSAARDRVAATGEGCVTADQRGATRPGGTACDIGAYEVAPPGAATGPAEAVQANAATLTGTVEPRGLATSYRFEFGTTTAYGSQTAAQSTPPDPGAVAVAAALTGLDSGTTYHYRLVATGPDGTATGEDRTFQTGGPGGEAPEITAASLSRRRFAVGRVPTRITPAQRRVARGTTIRLTLSEAATLSIRVERRTTGLRVRRGGRRRCVRATPRRLRQAPRRARCKRFVRAGRTLTRQAQAGPNRVAFSGRIGRKALRRGPHRFRIAATDPSGNRSAERRLGFTIVRARR